MKYLTLFTLFYSSILSASYFEDCLIKAKVIKQLEDNYYLIKTSTVEVKSGSHGDGCKTKAEKELKIKLKKVKLEVNKNYEFNYSFINSMGPNGVVNSEEWTLPSD